MSGTPSKTGARIALIIVLIPICYGIYCLLPFFLPMWRWENMRDWTALSVKLGKPAAQLQKTYEVIMRYNPRGDDDPTPWQILESKPLFDPENDEEHHIVRCTLVSERTGTPPSALRLGSNYRDQFFKGTVWRFPPGAFSFNKFRPVLVYDGWTFEKLQSNQAYQWKGQMEAGQWTNDDDELDEDGYKEVKAAAAEAAAEAASQ